MLRKWHRLFTKGKIPVADSLNRRYNDTHRYVTYIVINVQTRGLLAVETKDSFVLWLAKDLFVNSECCYRTIPGIF